MLYTKNMIDLSISIISDKLISLQQVLPLPIFVIVGSVIEELISPIPATLILGVAGSVVAFQGTGIIYLTILIILATAGKTLAAWATYWAGRLLGRIVVKKWGYILGINLDHLEQASHEMKHHKSAWKWIFLMRALPIAPSAAVSIAAGMLYIHQRVFLTATFLGYIIRNVLTAATGYWGLDVILNWDEHVQDPWIIVLFILLACVIALYIATLHNRPKK